MPDYYLDSSALLKRYKTEKGSSVVQTLFGLPSRDRIATSQFTILEISATAARLRKGAVDATNRLEIILVGPELISEAMRPAATYALKAPDALQLASAIAIRRSSSPAEVVFVAADLQLTEAARLEGFEVLNPDLA